MLPLVWPAHDRRAERFWFAKEHLGELCLGLSGFVNSGKVGQSSIPKHTCKLCRVTSSHVFLCLVDFSIRHHGSAVVNRNARSRSNMFDLKPVS